VTENKIWGGERCWSAVSCWMTTAASKPGLLTAVYSAALYRYYSSVTFTVALAVAPLHLGENNGHGNAATFLPNF